MSQYYQRSPFGFFANIPPVVKNIIIINVAMLVLTMLTNDFMYKYFALYYPASPLFKPYQFLTHMFMHGGIGHLFFNMYAFWLFGSALEHVWGGKKFLIYYLVTGIGAAAFYSLVLWLQVMHAEASMDPATVEQMKNFVHQPGFTDEVARLHAQGQGYANKWLSIMTTPMVGASGAVFGVLLAYGMLFPNTELQLIFPPVTLKAKWFVLIYGAIELVLALSAPGDSIAHFAHVGGMLFGYILVVYWKKKGKLYW